MNTDQWQKIDTLFDEYLDASPEEKAVFLDQKCDSEEIRFELEKLISALDQTEDFIENPTFTSVKKILDEDDTENLVGTKIYSYQIEKLLGKGGMGTVYLAKRVNDFNKEVAIKIIPPFAASRNSKENFRRERQILAKLDHPNIAQILDGGTTENGLPFLVMEYIDGVSLNEFCENLDLESKLNLFQNVCNAVDYAHKNFVVHRDLKPTNILVKKDGTVKLLDFGIAKLLQTDALDDLHNVTLGGPALTPEYASPEQFNNENITIASDIYSLGVIFYEILTNNKPHNFKGKSLNETLKIISKEDPKPSKISNEIDAILLKALAKKPENRYQTAEAFRKDIYNYINDLPISAQPNTAIYKLKKFVYRNKIQVSVAAGVLLLIFGWLATSVWHTVKTASQAKENRRSAYSAEMILAANEYEKTNLNSVNELIQKYLPNADEEDLRGYEWFFLKNLLNPPSKITSFIHQDEIWNLEFSPDGKYLTTVSNDNFVRTWNVETGEANANNIELKGAWKCSYFPDSKRFAVSASSNSNPIVKIYNAETTKEILTLNGHEKRVRAVDVSPIGNIIATGSQDGTVRIWNANTGEQIQKFEFATKEKGVEILDVDFSNDGEQLVIVGFESLGIIDTKTWQTKFADLNDFTEKNVSLFGWKAKFSPDKKMIAVGNYFGEIIILDTAKLTIQKVIRNHQANVKTLSFLADGKVLASGSWDRTVKFFDVESGNLINELKGHFAGVHEIAFSPDYKILATASGDFNVNLWDTEKVAKSDAILLNISLSSISNTGKFAVSWNGANKEIGNWNLQTKEKLWTVKTPANIFSIDISEISNLIAIGDREGYIYIISLIDGKELAKMRIREKTIFGIRLSLNGQNLFAAYEDGIIQSINIKDQSEIFNIKAHENNFKPISISPNGKYVATGGNDKIVKLFDVSGKQIFSFNENQKPIYALAFSNDSNMLASVGADDKARIWRISDGKLLHELTGMSAGIFAVAFSPDEKRLATASDVGVIRLWDLETGKQVFSFSVSQKQINLLRFTEDGKVLIAVDTGGKANFLRKTE